MLIEEPTPTWATEDGSIRLYCADCMEVLPKLRRVDCAVTDPPYGVGFAAWDVSRPSDAFFDALRRVSPSSAVHCAQGEMWGWPKPDWVMAWFMPGSVNRTKTGKFRHWEPVLVYGKEKAEVDSKVFPPIGAERNGHPCPKPDAITEWLVNAFAKEGEMVLDPYMGSGTTGVACIKFGRRFTGIEISREYFDIAVRRIKDTFDRYALLEPVPEIVQMELF